MEARPKQGEDIQSTDGDTLVITIAIILHGCVTTMDIDPTNYNLRYISETGDKLDTSSSSRAKNWVTLYELNNAFRKDTPGGDNNELRRGDGGDEIRRRLPYFDSLPYDKVFTVKDPEPTTLFDRACCNVKGVMSTFDPFPNWMSGIWVASVHKRRKPQPINDYKYVYPEDKERFINLLNLKDFEDLNENFNKIPDLKNTIIREGTRIHEGLDGKYMNIIMNDDNTHIESVRLSYLLELLKQIIGPKCGFNIYDYSCSNACNDSSITDTKTTTSLIDGREAGKRPFFGGRKRKSRKTKRRRSRKYKRSKRKTRSKRPRGGQQNNKRRL